MCVTYHNKATGFKADYYLSIQSMEHSGDYLGVMLTRFLKHILAESGPITPADDVTFSSDRRKLLRVPEPVPAEKTLSG